MEKTFFLQGSKLKIKKYGYINVCPFQYVHSDKHIPNKTNLLSGAVVVHTFYPNTWEIEAVRSLGLDQT